MKREEVRTAFSDIGKSPAEPITLDEFTRMMTPKMVRFTETHVLGYP